jgi:hypothetical protein
MNANLCKNDVARLIFFVVFSPLTACFARYLSPINCLRFILQSTVLVSMGYSSKEGRQRPGN